MESRDDPELSLDLRLKFWKFVAEDLRYSEQTSKVKTRITINVITCERKFWFGFTLMVLENLPKIVSVCVIGFHVLNLVGKLLCLLKMLKSHRRFLSCKFHHCGIFCLKV